jgi:hypothetical protein
MLDDFHSDDLTGGLTDGRDRTPDQEHRPLSDREVPLGPPTATLADAVHAWLDGDIPESTVRRGDSARDVEFWKRLDGDLMMRRRMRTPSHLQARIMDALPMSRPQIITPWWQREYVVTPSSALVAAATLMAAAAAATALAMRLPR